MSASTGSRSVEFLIRPTRIPRDVGIYVRFPYYACVVVVVVVADAVFVQVN
jgi:hypothetical protein